MGTTQGDEPIPSCAELLRQAIEYAETTYERDNSGKVIGGDVEPEFVRLGIRLLRQLGEPI